MAAAQAKGSTLTAPPVTTRTGALSRTCGPVDLWMGLNQVSAHEVNFGLFPPVRKFGYEKTDGTRARGKARRA